MLGERIKGTEMYVITGGAGFIGSNVAAALDERGDRLAIVDWLGDGDFKWRNIAKRRLADIVAPEERAAFFEARRGRIFGVVHMGAISTTTETDVDKIVAYNFKLSVELWKYCAVEGIPFIYASSAATYGDGSRGFGDRFDDEYLSSLRPLNPYGWSKHLFDRWVLRAVEIQGALSPSLGWAEILQRLRAQ